MNKKKWRIAYSHLNNIFNALQEFHDLQKILKIGANNKEKMLACTFEIDNSEKKYYSDDMAVIKILLEGSAITDYLYQIDCDIYLKNIYPTKPGGLFNIERIVDSSGLNLMAMGVNGISTPNKIVCSGEEITLIGSFTHSEKPDLVFVCVPITGGFTFAKILNWSQTEIKIIVPPDARRGCIFILDYGAKINYFKCIAKKYPFFCLTLPEYDIFLQAICDSLKNPHILIPVLPPALSIQGDETELTPPCCDNFPGIEPIIEYIKINGKDSYYQPAMHYPGMPGVEEHWVLPFIWNGEEIEITFLVRFAENVLPNNKGIIINVIKPDGTCILTQELDACETSFRFTPQLDRATELTVELHATNKCLRLSSPLPPVNSILAQSYAQPTVAYKYVHKSAKMIVQLKPQIKILGVEVTQGIQKFNLPSSQLSDSQNQERMADNNSVPLIEKRTTVLRVYIDTGLVRNLDTNIDTDIVNVETRRVQKEDEVRITGTADFGGTWLLWPENHQNFFAKTTINRDKKGDSLNFKVPGYFIYENPIYFHIKVYNPDRPDDECFKDSFHLHFNNQFQRDLDLCIVLYDNAHKGHEKTVNHDGRTDDEIRWDTIDILKRYLPVSDDGINLYVPFKIKDQHKKTKRNLFRNDKKGWYMHIPVKVATVPEINSHLPLHPISSYINIKVATLSQ